MEKGKVRVKREKAGWDGEAETERGTVSEGEADDDTCKK